MKLTIRIKDTPTGRHLVLCDERGQMLPLQKSVSLQDRADGVPTLTVEFQVDGYDIALGGDE